MDTLFKQLLDNFPLAIWIMDKDLKYSYVNNKFVESSEYENPKEFLGKTMDEVFNLSVMDFLQEKCLHVLENKYSQEVQVYFQDEHRECTIVPLFNEARDSIGIAGIMDMKSSYHKLQERDTEIEMQKNLTRHIMDLLPGVIFYKDRDSKYVYANAECREFYREKGIYNILGKTDKEINADKRLSERFINDDRRIIENKETLCNDAVFHKPDGTKEYREVIKMPLVDSWGKVQGIIGRSMDVTKQRMAVERLKYLSYVDILTGLKNRTSFEEKISEFKRRKNPSFSIIMGDANGLKLVNDTLGHQEGDRLLVNLAEVLKVSCEGYGKGDVYRIGGDEFAIIIENSEEDCCEELMKDIIKRCQGFEDDKFNISIALGKATTKEGEKSVLNVIKEADDNAYKQKMKQQKCIKTSILNTLKTNYSAKSIDSEEHTERVSLNAVKVGEKMGLNVAEILELKIAGEIHDIGKIAINDEVLEKPDKLTNEEYEIIKTHAEKGYNLVKATNELRGIADGVLCHHERWDGKGYPLGLKGEEIPLISRIICVADAYDVMTNGRIYRKAIDQEEAIKELRGCAGTQFDPKVVEVFIECLDK